MPPRARNTGPEFMSSETLAELIAAELETLAAGNTTHPDEHGAPVLTPTERARRSMLNRAADEIRQVHRADEPS